MPPDQQPPAADVNDLNLELRKHVRMLVPGPWHWAASGKNKKRQDLRHAIPLLHPFFTTSCSLLAPIESSFLDHVFLQIRSTFPFSNSWANEKHHLSLPQRQPSRPYPSRPPSIHPGNAAGAALHLNWDDRRRRPANPLPSVRPRYLPIQ